jgi:hypothetical protein
MLIQHDVSTTPMSVIGWDTGGMRYLILFIVLTLPFCLYLVFFLNKHFIGNKKFINIISVISCILITTGSFIPVRQTEPAILLAHTIVSVTSSIILMLTILLLLVLHAVRQKRKAIILSFYGIYVAFLSTAFYILYTAALFQLMATVSFFIILLSVNTASPKRQDSAPTAHSPR